MKQELKKIIKTIYGVIYRLRIKKNISIISNDCCAGCIYSDVGFKFLSPTINLYINGSDFLKFVNNIEEYFNSELIEYKKHEKDYPIGIIKNTVLGDVKIDFIHYKNFEEAKNKWNERKQRVDFSNILILYHVNDENIEYINEILKLNFNKKIIAYKTQKIVKHNDIIILRRLKKFEPAKILQTNKLLGRRYLEEINYIELFNSVNGGCKK